MAARPKKRAARKSAAKKTAPKPQPSAAKRRGDPVQDWWAEMVNTRQIVGEAAELYLSGQLNYEEAERVWRQAHASQNVWSEYEAEG